MDKLKPKGDMRKFPTEVKTVRLVSFSFVPVLKELPTESKVTPGEQERQPMRRSNEYVGKQKEAVRSQTMSGDGVFKADFVYVGGDLDEGERGERRARLARGTAVRPDVHSQLRLPAEHMKQGQLPPSHVSAPSESTAYLFLNKSPAIKDAVLETANDKHCSKDSRGCGTLFSKVSPALFVNQVPDRRTTMISDQGVTRSTEFLETPTTSRESVLSGDWLGPGVFSSEGSPLSLSRTISPCSSVRSGVFSPCVIRVKRHSLVPGSSLVWNLQSCLSPASSSPAPSSYPPSPRTARAWQRPPPTQLTLLTAILRKGRLPVLSSVQQRAYCSCWPISAASLSSCRACKAAAKLALICPGVARSQSKTVREGPQTAWDTPPFESQPLPYLTPPSSPNECQTLSFDPAARALSQWHESASDCADSTWQRVPFPTQQHSAASPTQQHRVSSLTQQFRFHQPTGQHRVTSPTQQHTVTTLTQQCVVPSPTQQNHVASLFSPSEHVTTMPQNVPEAPSPLSKTVLSSSFLKLRSLYPKGSSPSPCATGDSPAPSPLPKLSCTPVPKLFCTPVSKLSCSPEPKLSCTPEPKLSCTPEPKLSCTPEPKLACTPEPKLSYTPEPKLSYTPEPKITCTPLLKLSCTPVPKLTCTPEPKLSCTPEPKLSCTPVPKLSCTPVPKLTCTPEPKLSCTPEPKLSCTPVPKLSCSPVPKLTCTTEPKLSCTPEPKLTCTPVPKLSCTPVPKLSCTPVPKLSCTPEPKLSCTPVSTGNDIQSSPAPSPVPKLAFAPAASRSEARRLSPFQNNLRLSPLPEEPRPQPPTCRLSPAPWTPALSPSPCASPRSLCVFSQLLDSQSSTPDRLSLSPSPATSSRELLTPSPSLSPSSSPVPRGGGGGDRAGRKRKYKIKSSYKALAAIPTNTLLLEQQAIDDEVEKEGPPLDDADMDSVSETHSEMCSPAQLRQQSEELYAAIDQVLQDPLPMCRSQSAPLSLPTLADVEVPKRLTPLPKSAGRETKYAAFHLQPTGSAERNLTKPGVIRPVVVTHKLTKEEVEEDFPNPFRLQYLEEMSEEQSQKIVRTPASQIAQLAENHRDPGSPTFQVGDIRRNEEMVLLINEKGDDGTPPVAEGPSKIGPTSFNQAQVKTEVHETHI